MNPIFLRYLFNGWQCEFYTDYVEVVNPANYDRYRIQCDPYANPPFLIQCVEKGQSWDGGREGYTLRDEV
jgi:hypothetical protein